MPTERFFRLPDEKQLLIRDAALDEFTRKSLEQASINQIIQKANISRGSFYTYFEDKYDVVRYIFQDIRARAEKICEESLERTGGNYWEMMADLFQYISERCQDHRFLLFARNALACSRFGELFPFSGENSEVEKPETLDIKIFEKVNLSGMTIHTLDEFRIFHGLCMANIPVAMSQLDSCPEKKEEIQQGFMKKLEMIRYGVCVTEPPKKQEKEERNHE